MRASPDARLALDRRRPSRYWRGLGGPWVLVAAVMATVLGTDAGGAQEGRHTVLDHILDTYVRNGLVYYRALGAERGSLDRYIASLDVSAAKLSGWTPAEQQAFWLNAYNVLVLRTVIDAYPIRTRSADYPDGSIRQIPGAFDRAGHRVGSRTLTLDGIEMMLLDTFGDARLALALGRGAVGSPRLRSEAFVAERLEAQLAEATAECATRISCARIDLAADAVELSPIIGWREAAFIRSFEPQAAGRWANRSAVERAAAAMVYPHVFDREQAVLERNTFRVTYGDFDWRLNDLGGRSPFPQIGLRRGQRPRGHSPSGPLSPLEPDLWKRAPSP